MTASAFPRFGLRAAFVVALIFTFAPARTLAALHTPHSCCACARCQQCASHRSGHPACSLGDSAAAAATAARVDSLTKVIAEKDAARRADSIQLAHLREDATRRASVAPWFVLGVLGSVALILFAIHTWMEQKANRPLQLQRLQNAAREGKEMEYVTRIEWLEARHREMHELLLRVYGKTGKAP